MMKRLFAILVLIPVVLILSNCSFNNKIGYDLQNGQMIYRSDKIKDEEFIGVLEKVDLESFEVLKGYPSFAHDHYHVYGRSRLLDGIDPATFSILKQEGSTYYAKDENGQYGIRCKMFYCNSQKIDNFDPETVETIDYGYFKDKDSVFINGKKLEGADVNTFSIIKKEGEIYSKDAHHVYLDDKRIENASPSSFFILKEGYSIDADHVFFEGKIVEKVKPQGLEIMEGGDLLKDSENVYYIVDRFNPQGDEIRVSLLNSTDPDDFVAIWPWCGGKIGVDNNHLYKGDKTYELIRSFTNEELETLKHTEGANLDLKYKNEEGIFFFKNSYCKEEKI